MENISYNIYVICVVIKTVLYNNKNGYILIDI